MRARTLLEENAHSRMPKLQIKVDYLEIFSNSTQKAGENMCVFICECQVKVELYRT